MVEFIIEEATAVSLAALGSLGGDEAKIEREREEIYSEKLGTQENIYVAYQIIIYFYFLIEKDQCKSIQLEIRRKY